MLNNDRIKIMTDTEIYDGNLVKFIMEHDFITQRNDTPKCEKGSRCDNIATCGKQHTYTELTANKVLRLIEQGVLENTQHGVVQRGVLNNRKGLPAPQVGVVRNRENGEEEVKMISVSGRQVPVEMLVKNKFIKFVSRMNKKKPELGATFCRNAYSCIEKTCKFVHYMNPPSHICVQNKIIQVDDLIVNTAVQIAQAGYDDMVFCESKGKCDPYKCECVHFKRDFKVTI